MQIRARVHASARCVPSDNNYKNMRGTDVHYEIWQRCAAPAKISIAQLATCELTD